MTGHTGKSTKKLSPREMEVAILSANGKNLGAISIILGITESTVGVHKSNVFTKLDIHNTLELAMYAIKEGWIPCPCKKCTEDKT